MSDLSGPEVRGLRAAARLTGRSPSGLQKLIDAGRLAARKDDENAYVFAAADLAAVRRDSSASAGTAGEMTPDHAAVDDEPDLQGLRPAALLDVVPVAGAERFDEGTTAATVFASLNANRTLVEIVVDHKLAPDVVRRLHNEWVGLRAADTEAAPAIAGQVRQLDETVVLHAGAIEVLQVQVAELAQHVANLSARTTAGQRTESADGAAMTAIRRRIADIETRIAMQPATPIVVGPCGCGGAVSVLAACTSCGAGRGAIG